MSEGPIKIAEYSDEMLAVNAQNMLKDQGIDAKVLGAGVVLGVARWELYVKNSQAAEAIELLREWEAGIPADDDDDQPEGEAADCEGPVE